MVKVFPETLNVTVAAFVASAHVALAATVVNEVPEIEYVPTSSCNPIEPLVNPQTSPRT
jgi:hypothetical protein